MYWSNYHSHCTFCDGRSSMEDFVRFAISKNVKKYGFSSHAPLPFHTKWTMEADNYTDYEAEFKRIKQKYINEIELYLGLEVDYIHDCSDISNSFFTGKQLDYTIGSIHYLDKLQNNEYWSIDGAFRDFNEGLQHLFKGDIQAGTRRFFEMSTLMIEKGGFDIVGHVDKITYHGMKYRHFSTEQRWYKRLMTQLLELIKSKNLILEINTKSLKDHGFTFPHHSFYPLIHEMGIPVHVNSDCHYPTNITNGFLPVYKQLYETGFRTMHQLSQGKWRAIEFNENGLLNP